MNHIPIILLNNIINHIIHIHIPIFRVWRFMTVIDPSNLILINGVTLFRISRNPVPLLLFVG